MLQHDAQPLHFHSVIPTRHCCLSHAQKFQSLLGQIPGAYLFGVCQLNVRPAHSGKLARDDTLSKTDKAKIPEGRGDARSRIMKQQQVGRLHAQNAGALAQRSLRDLAVAGHILFAKGSAPAPSGDASRPNQHDTLKMGFWALTPRLEGACMEAFISVSKVSTEPCLQQHLERHPPDTSDFC